MEQARSVSPLTDIEEDHEMGTQSTVEKETTPIPSQRQPSMPRTLSQSDFGDDIEGSSHTMDTQDTLQEDAIASTVSQPDNRSDVMMMDNDLEEPEEQVAKADLADIEALSAIPDVSSTADSPASRQQTPKVPMTPSATQSPEAELVPLVSSLPPSVQELGLDFESQEHELDIKEEEDPERARGTPPPTPLNSKKQPTDTSSWSTDVDLTEDQDDDLVEVKQEIDLTKEVILVEHGGWNDLSGDINDVKIKEEIDLTEEIIGVDHGAHYDLISDSDEVDSVKSESQEEDILDQEHTEADGFDDDFDEDFLEQELLKENGFDEPPNEEEKLATSLNTVINETMRAHSPSLFMDDNSLNRLDDHESRPIGGSSSLGGRNRSIPLFPNFGRRRSDAQNAGGPLQQGSDLPLALDDDSDENSGSSEAEMEAGPSSAGKKTRKSSGPRAKTAREWHQRNNAKLTPAQLRSTAWKEEELGKLEHRIKDGTQKRNAPRATKQPAHKRTIDPRIFLGGGVQANNSVSPRRSGDLEERQVHNSSKTAKDWWKTFLQQNHGIDLHQCNADKNAILGKSRTFGYRRMRPSGDGSWKLENMPTELWNHQLICVAFLVARECAVDAPFGSICADAMGLGKTIQTIALLIANPPGPEHIAKNQTATLIVAPSSVNPQWLAELQRHAGEMGQNVMMYSSGNPAITLTTMKRSDNVLTTYHELFTSYPHPPKALIQEWKDERPKVDMYQKLESWVEEHKDRKGKLHQVDWYRIVLDEGHYIKNYLSRTSRAAIDLKGRHRLILSGTPIMNSYEEFHPLLKFIREPLTFRMSNAEYYALFVNTAHHANDVRFWQKFCGEATDEEAVKALSILISNIIIHRTMGDQLLGKPIIPLKPDHRFITEIEAHPAELYLSHAFVVRLGELKGQQFGPFDERKPLKNGHCQLTRQRQGAASFDIISRQYIAVFELGELRDMRKHIGALRKSRSKKDMAHVLHSRLRMWIQEKKAGVYKNSAPEDDIGTVCLACKVPCLEHWRLKKCKHTFCQECIDSLAVKDLDGESEVLLCPKCGKSFRSSQAELITAPVASSKQKSQGVQSALWKGKDVRKFRPGADANQLCFSRWLAKIDQGKIDLLPSSKLLAIKDQVAKWRKQAPNDKIIIFTQWRPFQVAIGRALEQMRIKFIYFSGDMSSKQREKAKKMFEEDKSLKVMVSGLKCGGIGINLTAANRVIVADMWWNSCIDNQAFGRVFRMGQKKETWFAKMSVQQTIDEGLLLMLQRKKDKLCNKVMQDDLTHEEAYDLMNGGFSDETFAEFIARREAEFQAAAGNRRDNNQDDDEDEDADEDEDENDDGEEDVEDVDDEEEDAANSGHSD